MYKNDGLTPDAVKRAILKCEGQKIPMNLAGKEVELYFTQQHLDDLRAALTAWNPRKYKKELVWALLHGCLRLILLSYPVLLTSIRFCGTSSGYWIWLTVWTKSDVALTEEQLALFDLLRKESLGGAHAVQAEAEFHQTAGWGDAECCEMSADTSIWLS